MMFKISRIAEKYKAYESKRKSIIPNFTGGETYSSNS